MKTENFKRAILLAAFLIAISTAFSGCIGGKDAKEGGNADNSNASDTTVSNDVSSQTANGTKDSSSKNSTTGGAGNSNHTSAPANPSNGTKNGSRSASPAAPEYDINESFSGTIYAPTGETVAISWMIYEFSAMAAPVVGGSSGTNTNVDGYFYDFVLNESAQLNITLKWSLGDTGMNDLKLMLYTTPSIDNPAPTKVAEATSTGAGFANLFIEYIEPKPYTVCAFSKMGAMIEFDCTVLGNYVSLDDL
jgi:hypothetical protein